MVTLYDVLEVTGGHIYPSDGAAHFEVQLTSVCSTLLLHFLLDTQLPCYTYAVCSLPPCDLD